MAQQEVPKRAARKAAITILVAGLIIASLLSLIPHIGTALGTIVFLLAAVLAIFGYVGTKQQASQQSTAPTRSTAAPAPISTAAQSAAGPREHRTTTPSGTPVRPWLRSSTKYTDVVGEAFREKNIERLWSRLDPIPGQDGRELRAVALLVDDHRNPHDSNAVAVWFAGEHVGYLDRTTAKAWSPIVRRIADSGQVLEVDARLWAAPRYDRKGYNASATVMLPTDTATAPANELPGEPHVLLPIGGAIQVTKEEDHLDVLKRLVTEGGTTPVAATLHAIQEIRPRSVADAVEVRINGERVGILSPTQTANMLPLVRHIEARGKVAVARAGVTGSIIKADVVLYAAKASEVTTEWLDAVHPLQGGKQVSADVTCVTLVGPITAVMSESLRVAATCASHLPYARMRFARATKTRTSRRSGKSFWESNLRSKPTPSSGSSYSQGRS